MSPTTIVALASGPGPSGVGIIRISGPHAKPVLETLAGQAPLPRLASLRSLRGTGGDILDKALVVWFPAPASFTGEDVVELHVHGGRAVVADVIEACLNQPGVVLAKPGEYTRRAFENGKMDLSAAEGLGDLIDAETRSQRRQALRQMEGGLALEVAVWREDIIDALADAEGDIDFPDEDLPPGLSVRARDRISTLREKLTLSLAQSEAAIRVRDGFRVAILGVPNSGKSSLLNAIAKRDAAIVSPIAGTTRDVVEVRIILSGLVILLSDTAGLRDAPDQIEAQGISRARAMAETADLRIGVIAHEAERAYLSDLPEPIDIWILAKSDIIDWTPRDDHDVILSSLTGAGIGDLERAIVAQATQDLSAFEAAPLTRLRHKMAVISTLEALDRALQPNGVLQELVAEDLRLAARSLGQIIGHVDMEDVLDRLFSQFCIGK